MKLAKIILPAIMAFSLSGCSLLSNLLSGGKSNSGNSSNTSTTSQSTNTSSSSSNAITIEQVAADIGTSLGDELEYDSTYGYYNIGYDLSEDGQDYSNTQAGASLLSPYAEFIADFMPDYLGEGQAYFWESSDDYWEDSSGDTVYQIVYSGSADTFEADVEIISYFYDNKALAQVTVWPLSD